MSFRVNDPCRFERYVSSSERERPGQDLNRDLCDTSAVLHPLGEREACCYVSLCAYPLKHQSSTIVTTTLTSLEGVANKATKRKGITHLHFARVVNFGCGIDHVELRN